MKKEFLELVEQHNDQNPDAFRTRFAFIPSSIVSD
jgi:hypothetical protein